MENEELIGTLIETNDRLVAAMEMYDQLHGIESVKAYEQANSVTSNLASMTLESPTTGTEADTGKGKSRSASSDVFHDLEDLNFGPAGTSRLPPPMRPSALSDDGDDEEAVDHRVTLSDYSDYESSDEETHGKGAESSKRNYVTVSDDEDDASVPTTSAKKHIEDDPFADPFADK